MLGRLRMTVPDCIDEFMSLSAKIYERRRSIHYRSPFFWPRDKYNHRILEEAVRDLITRKGRQMPDRLKIGGEVLYDSPPEMCRTWVSHTSFKKIY